MQLENANMSQIHGLVSISKAAFDGDVSVGASYPGGPPHYDDAQWHTRMMQAGHLLAAMEEGVMIGGAVVFRNKQGELLIGRIFIAPEMQRKGYGMALMEALERRYADSPCICLDTPVWNKRTNTFYRKLGYTEVRRDEETVYYRKIAPR